MRVMFLAFAAVIVIAALANIGLEQAGFSSAKRQAADSVRLD